MIPGQTQPDTSKTFFFWRNSNEALYGSKEIESAASSSCFSSFFLYVPIDGYGRHHPGEIIISNDKYRMEEIEVNTYTYVHYIERIATWWWYRGGSCRRYTVVGLGSGSTWDCHPARTKEATSAAPRTPSETRKEPSRSTVSAFISALHHPDLYPIRVAFYTATKKIEEEARVSGGNQWSSEADEEEEEEDMGAGEMQEEATVTPQKASTSGRIASSSNNNKLNSNTPVQNKMSKGRNNAPPSSGRISSSCYYLISVIISLLLVSRASTC